ncbi:uncharacterized protein LOC126834113 [Adelges cooleyi]|uniref:uncharacterized protein LOC126834113 n=1 Tax=Adelges cooleyi TaxID=133065 RepID=UPI0021801831|nr:uncharacterized protein LOC126834113 [Adelges cooleyi]
MNRIHATLALLAATAAVSDGLNRQSTSKERSSAASFSKWIAQRIDNTLRRLNDQQDLQVVDGVHLIKTKTYSPRPAGNATDDITERLSSFMDSRSLSIDLQTLDRQVGVEGRRRHAYRRVFPIIVSTYMVMSAILIPLGFMFMSTLGGMALLVSKISLMVSLMSNIKKMFSYEYYLPPPAQAQAPAHHPWKRNLQVRHTTKDGHRRMYARHMPPY